MNRVPLLATACALVALVIATPAYAQSRAVEAQARALDKKAMEEDYLATEFDKATDKLNQAIGKCGTDKCSAALRAQLKRDLGVVQLAGQGKRDAAIASFAEAMRIDPNVQLDPDLKTKEVEAAWDEAKRQRGGGGAPAATTAPPAGDFTHTPAAEQQVRTPVPIYVEYGGSEKLAKVVAKYKAFGMTEWKTLELQKIDGGWGGEIPCADVQQGDVLYYIQGFNAQNDPVATSGDRNNPYRVPVKREKVAEAPHLPGREPAKQCADVGDCPPGFPGCKSGGASGESTTKGEGEECAEDTECTSGACRSGTCAASEEARPARRSKVWIGVSGQIDFVVLPTADDVCLLGPTATPQNTAGYYCTNSDGSDYPARPPQDPSGQQNQLIIPGKSDKVSGGIAPGNVRVMLSIDFAPTANILLGARVGYVLNTYPGAAAGNEGKTFAPVHAEARFTYVFGRGALAKKGLFPYAFVGGGVAEWDASVPVTVAEKGSNGTRSVQAWNIGGPGFVSVGGGLRYGFSTRFAGFFGPRFNAAFGSSGMMPSVSPELGVAVGF